MFFNAFYFALHFDTSLFRLYDIPKRQTVQLNNVLKHRPVQCYYHVFIFLCVNVTDTPETPREKTENRRFRWSQTGVGYRFSQSYTRRALPKISDTSRKCKTIAVRNSLMRLKLYQVFKRNLEYTYYVIISRALVTQKRKRTSKETVQMHSRRQNRRPSGWSFVKICSAVSHYYCGLVLSFALLPTEYRSVAVHWELLIKLK